MGREVVLFKLGLRAGALVKNLESAMEVEDIHAMRDALHELQGIRHEIKRCEVEVPQELEVTISDGWDWLMNHID